MLLYVLLITLLSVEVTVKLTVSIPHLNFTQKDTFFVSKFSLDVQIEKEIAKKFFGFAAHFDHMTQSQDWYWTSVENL